MSETQLDVVPKKTPIIGGPKGLQLNSLDEMWRFCLSVVGSRQFKDIETPEVALIRLQAGLELGLTPIWSLANIMVVNGRPAVWGDALLGIIRSHPQCESVSEAIEGDGDEMNAVCTVKRRGEAAITREFSVADAKRAGLWEKRNSNGSPTPWVTFPKRMLQMRARAFACRDAFADALRGFGVVEELRDVREEKPITATEVPPMTLPTVQDAVVIQPENAPPEVVEEPDKPKRERKKKEPEPPPPEKPPSQARAADLDPPRVTEEKDAEGNFIF